MIKEVEELIVWFQTVDSRVFSSQFNSLLSKLPDYREDLLLKIVKDLVIRDDIYMLGVNGNRIDIRDYFIKHLLETQPISVKVGREVKAGSRLVRSDLYSQFEKCLLEESRPVPWREFLPLQMQLLG